MKLLLNCYTFLLDFIKIVSSEAPNALIKCNHILSDIHYDNICDVTTM